MAKDKKEKKIRILVWADSPTSATGFAQVSRNILRRLAKDPKYQIDVIGINYMGDYYDREKHPYQIFPAMPANQQGMMDMYGRARVITALGGEQERYGLKPPWDIVFTIQDPFIVEGLGVPFAFGEQLRVTADLWKRTVPPEFWFKWIGYFPVDAPVKENWVTRAIAMPHYPVAYCDYGKKEMMKYDRENFDVKFNMKIKETDENKKSTLKVPSLESRIKVIPHGVDLTVFKPLPKKERDKFRKEFFSGQVKDDTFLVVNISRNQPRKDIARTLAVFSEFKKEVPNAHLYLHMKVHDAGGSVDEMARNFGLIPGEDYSTPFGFDTGVGYSIEVVNQIYNAADVCITTTLGEGWGFITSEAFATKTPIVAPNITSITDIFNCHVPMEELNEWLENGGWDEARGVPCLAGSTRSEWFSMGIEDNERLRPLTNVDDMAKKLKWVYDNPEKVREITDRAFDWVQTVSWENIVEEWANIFDEAYEQLQKEREFGAMIDKTNKNDPCPCGSGKKFKKCHGSKDNIEKLSEYFDGGNNGKQAD